MMFRTDNDGNGTITYTGASPGAILEFLIQ